jgi:hypothetical protein
VLRSAATHYCLVTHPLARRTQCGTALQHRVDDRVDVLVTTLKQEWEAVLDSQLKLLQEVRVMEGLDLSQEAAAAEATV